MDANQVLKCTERAIMDNEDIRSSFHFQMSPYFNILNERSLHDSCLQRLCKRILDVK